MHVHRASFNGELIFQVLMQSVECAVTAKDKVAGVVDRGDFNDVHLQYKQKKGWGGENRCGNDTKHYTFLNTK